MSTLDCTCGHPESEHTNSGCYHREDELRCACTVYQPAFTKGDLFGEE